MLLSLPTSAGHHRGQSDGRLCVWSSGISQGESHITMRENPQEATEAAVFQSLSGSLRRLKVEVEVESEFWLLVRADSFHCTTYLQALFKTFKPPPSAKESAGLLDSRSSGGN